MANTKGLQFKKLDLHVHTPASDDFTERHAKPEDIVNEAIVKDLSAIAITDHQTGAWIDDVKQAAKPRGLVIFPGIELKVHGGMYGIHLIILFDVDKGSSHVQAFLNTLKIYGHLGKPNVIANKSAIDIARELQEFDSDAILILAHCLSGQGVISDMRGEQRSELFKPDLLCLMGAESKEEDFLDKQKVENHDRAIDLFDGGFETFHYKKLGVYQASDAHSISQIGTKYTYFKIDDPITIEDIRQCLTDRSTRIRQSFEYKENSYPFIESVKITSGFLNDQEIELHAGLNSLLGAKGAGKSLVIEFLRFALNQPSQNDDIQRDHESKLDKCLKLHGAVIVILSDGAGKKYRVTRTYKPAESSPIEIVGLADGSVKNLDIDKLFPILFLSQNEIVKIAEDETNESQRRFIDRFFDFHKFQDEIEVQNKQLAEIDAKVANSISAFLKTSELTKKTNIYKEEIERLGKQITNRIFANYSKQEKIGIAIKNQISFLSTVRDNLEVTKSEYKDLSIPKTGENEIDSEPSVIRASDATKVVTDGIVEKLNSTILLLAEKRNLIQQELDDWEVLFEEIKSEYDSMVEKSGGDQMILDQRRKELLQEVARLEESLAFHGNKSALLPERIGQRKKVIECLEKAYKAYFDERKLRCEHFTKSSNGTLLVTITEASDTSAFYENLHGLKRGSWLKDELIKTISEGINPKNLIDMIFEHELSMRKDKRKIEAISKKLDIKPDELEKLVQHLLDNNSYEDIFALLYNSIPADIPSINYKIDRVLKPLEELSVGQKAVTLLIIALSDGNFPIIIDQPEDSLDLRTIWDDVCKKLRDAKDERQFIFTTHNSSVAVASDSDKFVILQAGAKAGKVLHSGSINKPNIKKEVIDYLEGGKETYSQKRKKYHL